MTAPSTRLTNHMRETIVNRVIQDRFEADHKALERDRAELALACYNEHYPQTVRDRMAALPDGWLPTDNDIVVKFGTEDRGYTRLCFNGYSHNHRLVHEMPEEIVKRFTETDAQKGCLMSLAQDHGLTVEFLKQRDEQEELDEATRKARSGVKSILNSSTTVKKLLEIWPEVLPYLGDLAPAPPPKVPAVKVEELNAQLRLPKAA